VTPPRTQRPAWMLPVIVFAQFAGTSLWFSVNAVVGEVGAAWGAAPQAVGSVTAAVQTGFIAGTLIFAVLGVTDRIPPGRVFFACAAGGALLNLMVALGSGGVALLMGIRAATGFCLAGIYPVGMKIAASWYARGLGSALGYLIGALVMGTALPHLIRSVGITLPWESVIAATSAAAALGGIMLLLLVPSGPYLPPSSPFTMRALPMIFSSRRLRKAALGYFGHMWELYALWAFIPVVFAAYEKHHPGAVADISLWSFAAIASGALGCVVGGHLSIRLGSAVIANVMLSISCACCLLSPILYVVPPLVFFALMMIWGAAVVGDSPQFSTIAARNAPKALVGSALTLINAIGFSITIVSMLVLEWALQKYSMTGLFLWLAPGPVFGLFAMRRSINKT
jgi:MFS family permease